MASSTAALIGALMVSPANVLQSIALYFGYTNLPQFILPQYYGMINDLL
jgi:hypothetical protein